MSHGSLDHLYHMQVTPPSPAMDSKMIPNPRIIMFYRRATYADVLAASDASWRNVLHMIDWERFKIPIPSEAEQQPPMSVGDVSSSEETDSAEERESSFDGSFKSFGNMTSSPVASPPAARSARTSQMSSRPTPVPIVQPVIRPIPNPHHAQTSIFRPSPTPLVFNHPKATIYGHPIGESQLQLKSPPPAHQPTLHPVVLKPIQNLSPLSQHFQHQQQMPQQNSNSGSSNRHLLMVYTKPTVNAKSQVIRLVNRNVASVGTNPGV